MNTIESMNARLGEIARLPLGEARALPGAYYVSSAYFDFEVEHVLGHEWHCLGRADEIPEPGDFFTTTLLREPLIVVRGDDGQIRVLSNVCRHRGMPVATAAGRTPRFVCPYHAWSYDRDGRLANAPRMGETRLERSNCRLPELRSELWNGFIYVNLDPSARALVTRLEGLAHLLKNYATAEVRIVHVEEETWQTNWKCLVENFMEAYHLSVVHPETLHPYTPTGLSRKSADDDAFTSYEANYPDKITSRGRGAPDLTDAERQRSTLFCLFPTQLASQSATLLVSFSLQPIAVDRVHVRWTVSTYGDELSEDQLASRITVWRDANREDREKLERLQLALASRHAGSGPLAPPDYEGTIWDFYRYLDRKANATTML